MPDFTIRGNPGAIRSRAQVTSDKGQSFYDTGDALSKIDTSGWTGRAADHFRDAHDLEPDRWIKAGNGFKKAGAALSAYATAVEDAQATARWAEGEYARGEDVTADARAAYDADVADAQQKLASGYYSSLTIVPFEDPGRAIRDNALAQLNDARSTLDNAAHTCAGEVRAGCADAPEEPNWLESGLKFVGGVLEGAGEAVWDLLTMIPFSPVNMVTDAWKVANGDLTPEELMKKYELSFETVEGMWNALQDDPVEFGKNLGKSLLDWDTWADDPARAIGHLVPDALAAAATGGAGALATRGGKGALDALDALGDLGKMDNLSDLNKLDDLSGLGRLDDLPGATAYDDVPAAPLDGLPSGHPDVQAWVDEVHAQHPELSREGIEGLRDYTTNNGYQSMNGELRFPTGDPAIEARINATNQGISELPQQPGTTYRGTNLPDSVLDDIARTGQYNDPAFSSSSNSPDVAESFMDRSRDNPTRITVEGRSGVDVGPFSAYRGESEILFPSNTVFDVVENTVGADGVRHLVLRERP